MEISKLPEKWQKLFMHKDVKPTLDACLEKIKDKNIIALPASGCKRIKNTGKPIIAKAIY